MSEPDDFHEHAVRSPARIWRMLKHLFETDDGSRPETLVTGLNAGEISTIYSWVRENSDVCRESTAWSEVEQADIPIVRMDDPIERIAAGDIQGFRHELMGLRFEGVLLPDLAIAIDDMKSISFDYRMGGDWTPGSLNAYLKFLCHVQSVAESAKVYNSAGGHDAESVAETGGDKAFARIFEAFARQGRADRN